VLYGPFGKMPLMLCEISMQAAFLPQLEQIVLAPDCL
jgi:hypothetical protein